MPKKDNAPDESDAPPPPPIKTIAELQAELDAANTTIATQKATIENLTAAKAEADADEKLIIAKVNLGLSRDQAVAVVKRQKNYDASPIAKKHRDYNEAAAKRKDQTATQ